MELGTILFNRYQILDQLSKKAGRRTFLAKDLESKNLVIVKILRFDADFEWDDHKLFHREALTLKNLDHPAIPKYLDYFDVEEPDIHGFALVQTYIDAPSLETVVKDGRKFSEAEVIELADRMLAILGYLHQQLPPVIHRDVKPSNILIGNNIDIYLVDFGSVQTAASTDGGTITIVGSDGYIPLEQFSGRTTTASDLYSLGMTIVYLLTGVPPTELAKVNGQIKFNAEISRQFYRWLEKMTYPFLDKRFDSATSAQTALTSEDGSDGDFIHLKPPGSQVILRRDLEKVEIRFPKQPLYSGCLGCLGCLLIVILTIVVIHFFYWNISLFTGFMGYAWYTCCDLSSKTPPNKIILIDKAQETFSMGDCWKKSKKIRWDKSYKNIKYSYLKYNPGYSFGEVLDENGVIVKNATVTIRPKLSLIVSSGEYVIGDDLSTDELLWLGEELSDFLSEKLRIIYPTPQLPPPYTE